MFGDSIFLAHLNILEIKKAGFILPDNTNTYLITGIIVRFVSEIHFCIQVPGIYQNTSM